MVEDMQESSDKGLFWRFRARLSAMRLIVFSGQFVAISVSFPGKDGEYKLAIKYAGIYSPTVPRVVGEWVEVAKGGENLLETAKRLTKI